MLRTQRPQSIPHDGTNHRPNAVIDAPSQDARVIADVRGYRENMAILAIVPQLRTTNLASSLRFYTSKLGMTVEFQYQDFYAGVRSGTQVFHLKLVDEKDPSIEYVDKGVHLHLYFETNDIGTVATELKANGVTLIKDLHDTPWGTRELVIKDDQGHTLCFGQPG